MLQQEEQKALKKIEDTRKKTREIQELQAKNDADYIKRLKEEQAKRDYEENEKRLTHMKKEKSTLSNKFKGNEVMMQKLAAASEVKAQK